MALKISIFFYYIVALCLSYILRVGFIDSTFELRFFILMTASLILSGFLLMASGILFSLNKNPSVHFLEKSTYLKDLLRSMFSCSKFLGAVAIFFLILAIFPYNYVNISVYGFQNLKEIFAFFGLFVVFIVGAKVYSTARRLITIIDFIARTQPKY